MSSQDARNHIRTIQKDQPGDYEHTPRKKECQDIDTDLYSLTLKLFDSK